MAEALAGFHFPDDLWSRIIYDMVLATRAGETPVERMVAALVPLYFGRVGSFVIENRRQTTEESEERVERQAREFELLKPYLTDRWRERFGAGPDAPTAARTATTSRRKAAPRAAARGRREHDHAGSRMTPLPLPTRVLIPVANPLTAEELVRIGAALLEPRVGELTALGIVEVPEGMPLSEGATRARHARRLLQRVLDYAPEGAPIHPIVRIGRHAAEGVVEAAAEQEADLIIFGWGGKSGPGRDGQSVPIFSPTIDEVVRDAPCDIAVVKQRGARDIRRILVPVRGGPHAELALRFADAIAQRHGATVIALHLVPPSIDPGRPRAGRARAERLRPAARPRLRRADAARGPERPPGDPA